MMVPRSIQKRARKGGVAKARKEHGGKVLDSIPIVALFEALTQKEGQDKDYIEWAKSVLSKHTTSYEISPDIYSPFMAVKLLSQTFGYSHRHIARVIQTSLPDEILSMPHKKRAID